jgi:hypothetical protein
MLATTKPKAGILGGLVLLLLASACAARTRVVGRTEDDLSEELVLRSANANANMLHRKLLLMDKDD